jgi:hypothetical protein
MRFIDFLAKSHLNVNCRADFASLLNDDGEIEHEKMVVTNLKQKKTLFSMFFEM